MDFRRVVANLPMRGFTFIQLGSARKNNLRGRGSALCRRTEGYSTPKGGSMKAIQADLSSEFKILEIHTFADLHVGDPHCNVKSIKDRVEYVQFQPNAFVVLNGDLIDNATRTSIGDSYAASMSPEEQVEYVADLLYPIKDRIIAVSGNGNHELRTYKKEGVNPARTIARYLGAQEKFSEEGILLWVSFGKSSRRASEGRKTTYSAYILHGTGGGKKEGSKVNAVASMASVVDADIYFHAHSHLGVSFKKKFYRANSNNRSIQFVDKLFVNTAGSLDYGGYGETGQYDPASLASPVVILDGEHRSMDAVTDFSVLQKIRGI